MRNVLVASLLLIISGSIEAQRTPPLPSVDGRINFSEVITVDGMSQDELYSKAKLWFADAFRVSSHVVQLDDRENGIILGKGSVSTNERASELTWRFTVKVQLRDDRYKVEFYDIEYKYHAPGDATIRLASRTVEVALDSYFQESRVYRRNGALKGNAQFVADKTEEVFTGLLASIRTTMNQQVLKDDF